MFITKKKYNQIIEHKDKSINDAQAKVLKLEYQIEEGHKIHLEIVAKLKEELKEAKDLKAILEKLYPLHDLYGGSFSISSGGNCTLNLPDTVLQYADDILGGKVIKQEGNKCLVIDKVGNVKTGLTKQKVDKGFDYKLIRE